MNDTKIPRAHYPLRWPAGRERTLADGRKAARFKAKFIDAWNGLVDELSRIGAVNVEISTHVPLVWVTDEYLPVVGAAGKVSDPGVAVHFKRGEIKLAIACDTYQTVAGNLRALTATLRAMREIARHGSTRLAEQALDGFRELAAPGQTETEGALASAS